MKFQEGLKIQGLQALFPLCTFFSIANSNDWHFCLVLDFIETYEHLIFNSFFQSFSFFFYLGVYVCGVSQVMQSTALRLFYQFLLQRKR